MAKLELLKKFIKKKKLQKVVPNEAISLAYLEKSRKYFETTILLIRHEKYEENISLTYYSMYYALLSLLFKCGIKSESHAASIIILKVIFGIDNSKMLFAKSERIDKQYYLDFEITKLQATEFVHIAEDFTAEITGFLGRLNQSSVDRYFKEFKKLIEL